MPRAPVAVRLAVVGALALHALILWDCAGQKFASIDESGHVPAGIAHWLGGDFSQYRVNPPLPRMIATLPVLLADPDVDGIYPADAPGARPEWVSAREFAGRNADRYQELLRLARLAGIGWSVLGGWLVYHWAGALYRTSAAGLLALVLWCFGPNVLAHAQMATPDVPAAVAALTATYVFWRYLRQPTWLGAAFAGALLGVAQLTKMTLLVLYAVWPALAVVHWLARQDAALRSAGRRALAGQALLIVALSLLVLNAGYGFQGTCRPLGEHRFVSELFSGRNRGEQGDWEPANRFAGTWLASVPVPVPGPYLLGMDTQRCDFESKLPSYLRGEWRHGGWWYYYLYGLGVKVPLSFWALALAALALTVARHPASAPWEDEVTLWLPALTVLTFVSSQTGFNHHLRYVLPLVPFVVVSTAKLGYFWRTGYWKAGAPVLALLVWGAVSSLSVHSHYLAYFNEVAGGPDNGHDHLLDSNIDWGQDLIYLKAWLDEHPEARPLGLAFYHILDPTPVVGPHFYVPPPGPPGRRPGDTDPMTLGPKPGYYALDVNFVRGASFFAPDGHGHYVNVKLHDYEYFRHFRPIAKAGYSIFIYHITAPEANTVRRELGLPPLPLRPSQGMPTHEPPG